MSPLPFDPMAQRKKYLCVRWIREYNDKHPEARITYAPGFNPETDVIGTPARETLKKVQRAAGMAHVDGHFDHETMLVLLPPQKPDIRRLVMATAHSQLGVHEWPDGSNSGPVLKYLAACGIGAGNPWCAAFVTWDLKQNSVTHFPPNPAYVPSWHQWAREKRLLIPVEQAQLGDLWIWWADQHIGFCDDTNPRDVVAYGLDGNVGAHGGTVTQVRRTSAEADRLHQPWEAVGAEGDPQSEGCEMKGIVTKREVGKAVVRLTVLIVAEGLDLGDIRAGSVVGITPCLISYLPADDARAIAVALALEP